MYRIIFLFFLILAAEVYLAGCRKMDTVVSEAMLPSGGEYWELLTIKGKPVGFQQTKLSFEEVNGESVRRFERQSRIIILRYGNRFDVALKVNSVSKLEGVFLSGTVQLNGGGEPIETIYQTKEDQLIVSNSSGQTTLSWKQGMPGPEAILYELLNLPMQTGEKRQVTFFEPAMHSYVNATLTACGIEQINVNGVTKKLLRIEVQNRLELLQAGVQTVSETLWTDAGGNIITHEIPMDEQTLLAVRVSQEKALEFQGKTPSVELGNLGVVPLNDSISQPHQMPKIEFIVETQEGLPTNRFPQTSFQSVELINEKSAKITVLAAVNNIDANINNALDNALFERGKSEAKPEDLASNQLMNLNDPQLIALANQVDSDSLTSRQTALALERLVHNTIQKTTFSIGLASSSEILKSKSGDCTEFAVLLAALCRAKKIPARITLGLVYTPFQQLNGEPQQAGMVFHLWNEVLIDGIWYPLDAVLALGGADAARIKITDTSLADNSLAPLCHSLLGVLGQIRIHLKKSESPP
ncbi:MAG: transglutaminase family protein [Planctomycetaceae bacterium]|nr:transglutaminase family protein [Planctomycetaceae bacterium]